MLPCPAAPATSRHLPCRARCRPQVLLGYYLLPAALDDPVQVVLNPAGDELRSKCRVWWVAGAAACCFGLLALAGSPPQQHA